MVSSHAIGAEACFVTSSNSGCVDLWTMHGIHVTSLGHETEKKSSRHRDLVKCAGVHASDESFTMWTSGDDGIVCRWMTNSKQDSLKKLGDRKVC